MDANVATPGLPQTANRQSVAFVPRLLWSRSGHLLVLVAPLVADAVAILVPIGVAWASERVMPTANTNPRSEASVRRSRKPVMSQSMGIYFRTASRIPSRACDLTTRLEALPLGRPNDLSHCGCCGRLKE